MKNIEAEARRFITRKHFASPPVQFLLIVFSLVISYFFVSEMVKLIYFKYWNSKNNKK